MAITRKVTRQQVQRYLNYKGFDTKQLDALVHLFSQDLPQTVDTTGGAGFTGGTGGYYKTAVRRVGDIITTQFHFDLTGLGSSTTDLDIIGVSTTAAYLGRVVAAQQGTIFGGRLTCIEAPAGGVTDIDLYSATEATGVFDAGIGTLVETALLTSGAAWTSGRSVGLAVVPAAAEYLYLTGGAAGTAATYTAGKFLLELYGTPE